MENNRKSPDQEGGGLNSQGCSAEPVLYWSHRERERESDENWLLPWAGASWGIISVRLHGLPDMALPGSWLIPIQLLLIFSHIFPEHFLLKEGTVAMAASGTLAIDAFFYEKSVSSNTHLGFHF